MKVKSEREVSQSCPTLRDPMDCSLPGSSSMGFSRQDYWSWVPLPSPQRHVRTLKRIETSNGNISVMEKWKDYVYWTPTMSQILSQILYLITFEFSQPCEGLLTLRFQSGHWVSKHIICSRSETGTRFIWLQSSLAAFSVMLWEWTESFTPSVSSVQISSSVVSDSLWLHESQHTRPPCPSPSPGVHSDSRPSSQGCHPAISSFVVPFYPCPQSLPRSESFPMSQLFTWGGQSTGVSALASFLPKKSRVDLLPNGLVGSPCSPRDSQESSPTPQFKSINSLALSLLHLELININTMLIFINSRLLAN